MQEWQLNEGLQLERKEAWKEMLEAHRDAFAFTLGQLGGAVQVTAHNHRASQTAEAEVEPGSSSSGTGEVLGVTGSGTHQEI